MANYYLYLLDAEGHIRAREILTTDTEAEAVERMKASCANILPSPLWNCGLGNEE